MTDVVAELRDMASNARGLSLDLADDGFDVPDADAIIWETMVRVLQDKRDAAADEFEAIAAFVESLPGALEDFRHLSRPEGTQ